jgi:hypothetical protein
VTDQSSWLASVDVIRQRIEQYESLAASERS